MWANSSTRVTSRYLQQGFTIVELLIVIVIIGILAGITIIAYTGVSQQAIKSSLSSDLENAAKRLKLDQVDLSAYPAATALANGGLGLQASPGTTYQYTVDNVVSPQTFCLTATKGTTSYYISSDGLPTAGACSGHTNGGATIITNMHTNPSLGTNSTGWVVSVTAGSTGTQTRETTGGPSGIAANFYRSTLTSAVTSSPYQLATIASGSSSTPVSASTDYRLSAYMRSSFAITNGFRIDVLQYDSGGVAIGSDLIGANAVMVVNTWQRVSRTVTTASNAAYMRVKLSYSGSTGAPIGATFDATAVLINIGTTLYNYADGNSSGWTWSGTANNSTSTGPAS